MRRLKIAIAGAGLGGLFAAAALAQGGCEVVVCERAPALGEAGAGIQISPNGARLLARIGVLGEVARAGFAPLAATLRRGEDGAVVLRLPLGAQAEARWGAPFLQIHRADLLAKIERAARAAGAELRLGAGVVAAATHARGAVLTLDGGDAVEADVALGADGLRSAVRAALFGDRAARFTGQVAWRGVVAADALPRDLVRPEATVWIGPGRHLVTYYVRAGALVNFVGVEERDVWTEESWSAPGDIAEVRAAFAGWHPAASGVLAAAGACLLWGLFDHPPLPAWSRGRVGLLGDACHPMLPFMAQGAVQAFEDGAALARLLPRAGDIEAALLAYHAARFARASRVQAQARDNARLYHARSPLGRLARHGPIAIGSRLAPGIAMARLDWLYGHVEPA